VRRSHATGRIQPHDLIMRKTSRTRQLIRGAYFTVTTSGQSCIEDNLVGFGEKNIRARQRSAGFGGLLPRAARPDRLHRPADRRPGVDRLRPRDRHLPLHGVLRLLADTIALSVGCPGRPRDHHVGVRRWTRRSPAPGARTAPSRKGGAPTPAPTRPLTSPTTSAGTVLSNP
jgi:hypothetical protein